MNIHSPTFVPPVCPFCTSRRAVLLLAQGWAVDPPPCFSPSGPTALLAIISASQPSPSLCCPALHQPLFFHPMSPGPPTNPKLLKSGTSQCSPHLIWAKHPLPLNQSPLLSSGTPFCSLLPSSLALLTRAVSFNASVVQGLCRILTSSRLALSLHGGDNSQTLTCR